LANLISIVDDDPLARSGLEDLVLAMGYDVQAFASGEDFIASETVCQTGCLITDLNMPGMSGLDLQTHLRHQGYVTPIIIVTAYPTARARSRALSDEATSFLTKPVGDQVLVDCLARAVGPPS
jgi:FixJ family two-component response regulator